MMPLKIRECAEKDDAALVPLLREMLEHMAAQGGPPVNQKEDFWSSLPHPVRGPDLICFVAEIGSGLVGWVLAKIQSRADVFTPRSSLHLHAIYVRPVHRRQGIGLSLLQHALQWGRAQGCEQADLNVLPRNEARHLYAKLGFKVFRTSMTLDLT